MSRAVEPENAANSAEKRCSAGSMTGKYDQRKGRKSDLLPEGR